MRDIRQTLAQQGLRCTRQRETIYEALAAAKSHPTAEELFAVVRALEPHLSLATVYNTLEAFTVCGLARKLTCPNGNGACRYDPCTHDHVHLSFDDGRVMDAPEDLSERILDGMGPEVVAELERRLGLRIVGLSIQVLADNGHPGGRRDS